MLPAHLMRELRYVEVYTAKRIRNLRAGTYTSRVRGAGFDFDEHRLYRPSDDVRRIDWNVTARLNEPFIRQTHAERELNVLIAVDLTRSMAFGSSRYDKKELTLIVAACLVFSALADQINTGFLIFTDRVVSYRPPRCARGRAWRFLEDLWALPPSGERTAILPAVRFLAGHLKKPSLVFLVSDFVTDEDLAAAGDLKILARRHDVVGVVVEDPAERALPGGGGAVRVKDLESGAEMRVGLSRRLRDDYAEVTRRWSDALTETFYRVPMEHVVVRADHHVIEPLLRLFAARRRP